MSLDSDLCRGRGTMVGIPARHNTRGGRARPENRGAISGARAARAPPPEPVPDGGPGAGGDRLRGSRRARNPAENYKPLPILKWNRGIGPTISDARSTSFWRNANRNEGMESAWLDFS